MISESILQGISSGIFLYLLYTDKVFHESIGK